MIQDLNLNFIKHIITEFKNIFDNLDLEKSKTFRATIGYYCMKPFNIKTGFGEHEVTLTILPHEQGYYKVIYFGGVLGAVRFENDTDLWEMVPKDEIEAGDLPFYKDDLSADRLKIVLNDDMVDEIGEEINLYINGKQ